MTGYASKYEEAFPHDQVTSQALTAVLIGGPFDGRGIWVASSPIFEILRFPSRSVQGRDTALTFDLAEEHLVSTPNRFYTHRYVKLSFNGPETKVILYTWDGIE
jgi:hypothetical protein